MLHHRATELTIFKPYIIKLVWLITLLNRSKSLKACASQKQDNAKLKFLRKISDQNRVRTRFVCWFAEAVSLNFFVTHKFNRKTALKLFSTGTHYSFILLYEVVSYTDQHKFLRSKGACIRMNKFAFSRHKNTHHHLNRCWLLVGNPK